MDGEGLQGSGPSLCRTVCRRSDNVAGCKGQWSVQARNEHGPRLDRIQEFLRWSGDDLRVSGFCQRRRAEWQQRELWRAAEFPVLGKPLRVLRIQSAITEPRQRVPR